MVGDVTAAEYLLAHKAAEEYRSKGYEVSQQVSLDFLPGFCVDLLVRKGDETKVIEVQSRSSLAANHRISELARIIDSKPGWSFELLLVGEPERLDTPEGAQQVERENILKRVEDAVQCLEAGFPEAAFLLVWSACEAATRELVVAQGASDARITAPAFILDQAVFQGVLSRDEYNHLSGMRKYRNAIAHGFSLGDFSDELVTELIETARRILAAASNGEDDPYK